MKVIFKAKAMQFKNGCLLLPATIADKKVLDNFCNEATSHIVTVTANYSKSNKTYNQCKTVFALTAILFECNYDRIPSSSENERLYRELLEEYAPKEPSLLNPEKESPIPLSRMNKREAAEFINSLITLIMENCDLTDKQQVDVKQIFEEFHANCGYGDNNPIDYDKDGNMLSEKEWREKNNFSFASGLQNETLQLHHILSRGAFKEYENCSWNWIMLTDEEHNRIFHDHGWEYFLDRFPNCAMRVKTAFDKGHQIYSLDLLKALKKLNLIDDMGNDVNQNNSVQIENETEETDDYDYSKGLF